MPINKNYDLRLFASMFVPSMLSGLLCVFLSLGIVGAIVGLTNYEGSNLQQEILHAQNRAEAEKQAAFEAQLASLEEGDISLADDYYLSQDFEKSNVLLDRAPVMAFWMFIGIMVYFLVTGIIGAITQVSDIEDEMHYIHARRSELLKEVYLKSAIRFAVLAVWLGFSLLFFRVLLPYCLAAAHVGAGDIGTPMGVGYALLSAAVLALCFHLHVVMLRLVALRPRLFSQQTSF